MLRLVPFAAIAAIMLTSTAAAQSGDRRADAQQRAYTLSVVCWVVASYYRDEADIHRTTDALRKMGSAMGKLLSGTALDMIGFPRGADLVPEDVINTLAWILVCSVVVIGSSSYYFWSRFHLPRKRHREILGLLQARRAAALSNQ